MSNSQIAFSPLGNTIAAVATGVQAPVLPKFDPQNVGEYRVVNSGAATVFLGTGPTAALAQAAAVAPIAGTPSPAVPLLSGAVEVLRFNRDTFFSAPATVFITPGQGL